MGSPVPDNFRTILKNSTEDEHDCQGSRSNCASGYSARGRTERPETKTLHVNHPIQKSTISTGPTVIKAKNKEMDPTRDFVFVLWCNYCYAYVTERRHSWIVQTTNHEEKQKKEFESQPIRFVLLNPIQSIQCVQVIVWFLIPFLAIGGAVGGAVYIAVTMLLGGREIQDAIALVRNR